MTLPLLAYLRRYRPDLGPIVEPHLEDTAWP
jgi:hypothetical protein